MTSTGDLTAKNSSPVRQRRRFPWIVANVFACALWFGYPSLRKALDPVKCVDNLQQVSTAIGLYSIDHDDLLPLKQNWADVAQAYALKRTQFMCPDLDISTAGQFGHAYSAALSGKNALLLDPSKTPIVFDSSDKSWNANGTPLANRDGRNNAVYLDGSIHRLR